MRRKEDRLQAGIFAFLSAALPPGAVVWSTPNGGARRKGEAGILRATGVRAGIPDLFILFGGRLIGIEVKTASGRESADQAAMRGLLTAAGAECFIARSIEDAADGLWARGVSLRAAVMSGRAAPPPRRKVARANGKAS